MSKETIALPNDVRTYGRPIGKVADEKILAFIREVENTIVRKRLGNELYLRLVELSQQETIESPYDVLIKGGSYTIGTESCYITGLLSAIAYYVYAQNVIAGDFESTRYGMVIKDDQYSQGITSKDRADIANQATAIADDYLRECLDFCKQQGIKAARGEGMHLTAGCIIRKIG